MRSTLQWGAVALAAMLLGAAEPQPFKSLKARDATEAFEKEMKKAEEEYSRRAAAARKAYRETLYITKGVAMRGGDLADANKMQAEIERLTRELDAPPPVGSSGGPTTGAPGRALVVQNARYGAGNKWADVTEVVRSHVQDGTLVETYERIPDPVPYVRKTLIVEGTFAGVPFVLTDSESHKVTFGEAPRREKK